ncbi:MAG: hypothetical protein E7293_04795 [Lachnospiraceae bacterium]|nr:hypothetical protein [Lachnospiraceae bacterium]
MGGLEEIIKKMLSLSVTDKIALLALFISVLSVMLSVYSLIVQRKLNTQNLQAIYFEKIFHEFLLEKIPTVATKLAFGANGRLLPNYKDVNQVMMEMIKKSKYFAYANNDFYCLLKEKTLYLEDELLILANSTIKDMDKQKDELVRIHLLISEIVSFVNQHYCK